GRDGRGRRAPAPGLSQEGAGAVSGAVAAGSSRVPEAFHAATSRTPGSMPIRRADSSVISATTGGSAWTVTLTRFPTAATRETGPAREFRAEPSGAAFDSATSHG